MRLFFSPSGTSPRTMRSASPSTIAVLPTPGSPISTGLFLVRRDSTWITRRISSSRPITGSSLPCARQLGQVAAVAFQRFVSGLRILRRHALAAAHFAQRLHQPLARRRRTRFSSRPADAAVVGQRQQHVLDGNVFVLELLGLVLGRGEQPVQPRGDEDLVRRAGRPAHLRQPVQLLLEPRPQRLGRDSRPVTEWKPPARPPVPAGSHNRCSTSIC